MSERTLSKKQLSKLIAAEIIADTRAEYGDEAICQLKVKSSAKGVKNFDFVNPASVKGPTDKADAIRTFETAVTLAKTYAKQKGAKDIYIGCPTWTTRARLGKLKKGRK